MGVRVRITVTGEVLRRRRDALRLHPSHEGGSELGDALRILAERARIDDGIPRIVVDVDCWRECEVNADRACLASSDSASLERITCIPGCGDGHVARQDRGASRAHQRGHECAADQTPESRLQVRCDEQWYSRELLERID